MDMPTMTICCRSPYFPIGSFDRAERRADILVSDDQGPVAVFEIDGTISRWEHVSHLTPDQEAAVCLLALQFAARIPQGCDVAFARTYGERYSWTPERGWERTYSF
jgi:hypothetical protein